jgi:hypothetical protein
VAEPVVAKEYVEDLGEQDSNGLFDYAYRYWLYRFDLDGRTYRARVYTDEPEEASVMGMDGTRHPEHDDDLRAIGEYLRREAGVRTILTLGAGGGFEPALTLD